MLALEKQVWQEKRTALSIQQKFRFEISEIPCAHSSCTDPTQATARLVIVFVSRIQNSGTGDNNFVKWKRTFRSDRPKWPDRSKWTTFKTGPEYSGRTKPKWSVPFDVPTEISGILGWIESAQEDWLVQTLGLRRPQRVGISWEPLCLLLDQQGDRRRLCFQGDPNTDQKFISLVIITT